MEIAHPKSVSPPPRVETPPVVRTRYDFNHITQKAAKDSHNMQGGYIVAKDTSHRMTKAFDTLNNIDLFIEWQERQPEDQRNFYEYILKDSTVKLHLDIDEKTRKIPDDRMDELTNILLDRVIEAISQDYGIIVSRKDFAILDSSAENLTSKHYILTRGFAFENGKLFTAFCKRWLIPGGPTYVNSSDEFAEAFPKNGVLDSVPMKIGSGRCWRMPNCCKHSSPRMLTIETSHSVKECLVTCFEGFVGKIENTEPKKEKRATAKKKAKGSVVAEKLASNEIIKKCLDNFLSIKNESGGLMYQLWLDDYNKWLAVGMHIKAAGAPLDFWIDWSSHSLKSGDIAMFDTKWKSFHPDGTGVPEFINLMTSIDPEITSHVKNTSIEYMTPNTNDIVSTMSHIWGNDHIYCNSMWWYLDRSIYIQDPAGKRLQSRIMKEWAPLLDKHIRDMCKYLDDENPNASQELDALIEKNNMNITREDLRIKMEKKYQTFKAVKEKTQSGMINNDFRAVETAFHCPTFEQDRDACKNILSFDNGVLDLKTFEFRQPKSCHFVQEEHEFVPTIINEFITKSTGYDFYTEEQVKAMSTPNSAGFVSHPGMYEKHMQWKKEITDIIHQILPTKDVREYLLRYYSTCLSGEVHGEFLHFQIGKGSNGKSKLAQFLALTFGDYCKTAHQGLLCGKTESSDSANASMMDLKGARMVIILEADDQKPMNTTRIKSMTGNDLQVARAPYGKTMVTFEPEWKIMCFCNSVPTISSEDGGIRRRFRVTPFETKFTTDMSDPLNKNHPHVVKADTTLNQKKIKRYRLPLMWILIDYYKEYVADGYKMPMNPTIKKWTDTYFDDNDLVKDWMETYFEKDPNNVPDHSSWVVTQVEVKELRTQEVTMAVGVHIAKLREKLESESKFGPMIKVLKLDNGEKYQNCWRGWRVRTETPECF